MHEWCGTQHSKMRGISLDSADWEEDEADDSLMLPHESSSRAKPDFPLDTQRTHLDSLCVCSYTLHNGHTEQLDRCSAGGCLVFVLCLSSMRLPWCIVCAYLWVVWIPVAAGSKHSESAQSVPLDLGLLNCWYLEMQTPEAVALLLLACRDCLPRPCVFACWTDCDSLVSSSSFCGPCLRDAGVAKTAPVCTP